MRLTDRIASLNPAVVTIAFVVLFAGSAVSMNALPLGGANWALAYSILMTLTMLPIIAWHYSIYRAASGRSEAFVGHRGRRGFLFGLCVVGMVIFLTTFPIWMATSPQEGSYRTLWRINTIAMAVGCISYFLAIWAAANALTRFDEQKKSTELHKTLGTFVLELYFPIGIWFIHSRIKKVIAAPLPAEGLP